MKKISKKVLKQIASIQELVLVNGGSVEVSTLYTDKNTLSIWITFGSHSGVGFKTNYSDRICTDLSDSKNEIHYLIDRLKNYLNSLEQ